MADKWRNFNGDESANTLTGTDEKEQEIFIAGAGDDKVYPGGGRNAISLGEGKDTVYVDMSLGADIQIADLSMFDQDKIVLGNLSSEKVEEIISRMQEDSFDMDAFLVESGIHIINDVNGELVGNLKAQAYVDVSDNGNNVEHQVHIGFLR